MNNVNKSDNSINNNLELFFLGQAGFIIKNRNNETLGFDLYLSDCVEKIEKSDSFKRLLPKIVNPKEISLDILITSHHHYDHFDYDSMFDLMNNKKTKLFAAKDCKKFIDSLNIDNNKIEYVEQNDVKEYEGYKINFVNCDHGQLAPEAIGFVITVDNKKIYYTGDTCLRLDMIDEIKKIGDIDIMIAPINGAYGNLNENECVKLFETIKPKYIIPCHYGMFEAHGGDINKFIELMKTKNHFENLVVMNQGDHYIIK